MARRRRRCRTQADISAEVTFIMVQRTLRNAKGVTIVEFALVLPIFFVLIAGIIDFSILFFVQHTLQFATREGARLGLVGRTINDANGNPLSREESIVRIIRDKASVAMSPGDVMISFYPVSSTYADPAGWQGTQDAGGPGNYMRVRCRFDFPIPLMSNFVPNSHLVLQAQSTYRNEFFN